jgi:solute carrier family 27 fatty acid transporter 1/4
VGAVGFFPRLAYPILPTSLVKVNEESGEILRNPKTGRVIPCKPNESGELIGKIINGNPMRDFQGYATFLLFKKCLKILSNIAMQIQLPEKKR